MAGLIDMTWKRGSLFVTQKYLYYLKEVKHIKIKVMHYLVTLLVLTGYSSMCSYYNRLLMHY